MRTVESWKHEKLCYHCTANIDLMILVFSRKLFNVGNEYHHSNSYENGKYLFERLPH